MFQHDYTKMSENRNSPTATRIIRPNVTDSDIIELIRANYGFTCERIKELNGYDDRNYHIHVNTDHYNNIHVDVVNPHGYVVKVINSLDSTKIDFFDAQTNVLLHLGEKQICCPKPVKTKDGSYLLQVQFANGSTRMHLVRVLEFIPGTILHNIPIVSEDDYKICYEIGVHAATLDKALMEFEDPIFVSHQSLWMLQNVPQLTHYLDAIVDGDRRVMVENVIKKFQQFVLSVTDELEAGIIHGDINEQNVLLIQNSDEVEEKWCVKSIIDFGDCHRSRYIFELAIAMAYAILHAKHLSAGGYVLAGYLSVKTLPERELRLLKICIAARICQSVVLAAYTNRQDPLNTYILTTSKHGWNFLEIICQQPEKQLLQYWNNISRTLLNAKQTEGQHC